MTILFNWRVFFSERKEKNNEEKEQSCVSKKKDSGDVTEG